MGWAGLCWLAGPGWAGWAGLAGWLGWAGLGLGWLGLGWARAGWTAWLARRLAAWLAGWPARRHPQNEVFFLMIALWESAGPDLGWGWVAVGEGENGGPGEFRGIRVGDFFFPKSILSLPGNSRGIKSGPVSAYRVLRGIPGNSNWERFLPQIYIFAPGEFPGN